MNSRALFYPSIDIPNEEWLKTAYLFWDEIDTIVPESLSGRAYNNYWTQYLEGEGFLRPFLINSDSPIVRGLAGKVTRYAKTEEGMLCLSQAVSVDTNPYTDDRSSFYLHNDKLPFVVQQLVANQIEDGWLKVSSNFADFYMTVLANEIANRHSFSLLTDSFSLSGLSSRFSEDSAAGFKFLSGNNLSGVCQNMLVKMVIDGIKVNPVTSFDDLRLFKESHRDELRRFRIGLDEMTNTVFPEAISVDGMRQIVKDIYDQRVVQAYNDLKASLRGSHISFFSGLSSIAYSGITTTALDMIPTLGEPIKFSIGAGVFFAVKWLAEYRGRVAIKRNNKMSYLLSINKELASHN